MFKGDNSNNAAPPFFDNSFPYSADVSNRLQLSGNLPPESNAGPVNYLGNNNGTPLLLPNRSGGIAETMARQQKLQVTLRNKICQDEPDRKVNILNQNPVSTGLRLSYDDDEPNSSVTSASGSMSNDVRRELDQQKEELDYFLRSQEENMVKGVRDLKQRQMISFLTAVEKNIFKKLHEKDLELETMTRKNKDLSESMKQVTTDAQNWCYMAKYNESLVNVLKTNLQQAMQDSNRGKEGLGESDVEDAASCIDPNNYLSTAKNYMICKSCKAKEVSVLLMPCRHLCLCKRCEGFVNVCPVCQMITTTSFEVYLS